MFSLFDFSSIFQGGQLTPFAPMCGRPRKRIDEHWPVGVVDGPVNGALVALHEHALAARVAVGGRRQRLCHPARHPHLLLDRRVRLRLVVVERRVRVLCVYTAHRHTSTSQVVSAFPVAAAKVWNGLPSDVTSASSLSVFKNRLKTYLFHRCYETV